MIRHPGLMVIDWSNLCHRAFHGLGGRDDLFAKEVFTLASSMAINAGRSLLNEGAMLVNVMDGGFSGRDKLFPDYKANRSSRESRPHGLIGALGAEYTFKQAPIPYLRVEGFEADDVMASLAWVYSQEYPDSPTYILSNDKDLYQAVTSAISILRHKGSGDGMLNMELVTPEKILEQYGFGPLQIIDYKALQGDVADCIPRVPGIGHGIACRLIQQWGSANRAIQAALNDEEAKGFTPKIKQTLVQYYSTIKLNRQLVRLRSVPQIEEHLITLLQKESPL